MPAGPKETISVRIDYSRAEDFGRDVMRTGIRAATLEAESILVDLLSQPGSGEIYPRGKGRYHRASAPGESPAVDTGELRRNRSTEVYETALGVVGTLSLDMDYAEALTIGTEHIEPRPSIDLIPLNYTKRLLNVFVNFARGQK
jgi:hypothetical protein